MHPMLACKHENDLPCLPVSTRMNLNETKMHAELDEIHALREKHKDASVKDALQLNLPIRVLPAAGGPRRRCLPQ